MADIRAKASTPFRVDWDFILNAGGVLVSLVAGLLTAKYFSSANVPSQADYGVIIGLIVSAIVFQIVMNFAVVAMRGRISDVEASLSYKLGMAKKIGGLDSELAKELIAAVETLSQRQLGVDSVRQTHLRRVVVGLHGECSIPIATEDERIDILSEIVSASKDYVYACTYAEFEYLREFWEDPSTSIKNYYRAQKRAISNGVDVKRVFIVPTRHDIANEYDALLNKIIRAHAVEAGMAINKRVFVVSESQAEAEFAKSRIPFKKQSFFVSDGQFCSSGEAQYGTTDAHLPKVHGAVSFFFQVGSSTCEDFFRKFKTLLRIKGEEPVEKGA